MRITDSYVTNFEQENFSGPRMSTMPAHTPVC